MGGTGGGPAEVQAFIRDYRREEQRRAERREIRRAARAAVRAARAAGLVSAEDRHGFPCAALCDACGRLAWDVRKDHPMRRDPAQEQSRACAHCGCTTWIDLQHMPTADALLDTERWERGAWRRFRRGALAALGSLCFAGLLFAAVGIDSALGIYYAGLLLLGLATLVVYRLVKMPREREFPRRWSMVLAPRRSTCRRGAGRVEPRQKLVAPLSGRECAAYEIGVRYDRNTIATTGSWALLEQRNAELRVGAEVVPANGAHLDLSLELFPRTPEIPARVHRYLRERGLDPYDPDLHIFESILAPGDHAELRRSHAAELLLLARN